MSEKHFIHDPSQLLAQALRGLSLTNPSLVVDEAQKIVRHVPAPFAQPIVRVISGGGAGHEPAFVGYVGQGLLSAAVSGSIFASPNSTQILHAIESVESTKGVLITVMNYTGDVLNFGVAVERAKARNPCLMIEMLVVDEDVGVPRSQSGKVGRRGIAGTCLVHKVTAAAAHQGKSLSEVASLGRVVLQRLGSIGVSLDRVHVPGHDGVNAKMALQHDEVELGMGIHNEAGSSRRCGSEAQSTSLVAEMLEQLISQEDPDRAFIKTLSPEAVLLVNNLGGLSPLELAGITTEVAEQLHGRYNVSTPRVYSGTFMTSLNGPGFSISLLFLQPDTSETILYLLDSPCEAQGWVSSTSTHTWGRSVEHELSNRHTSTIVDTLQQHRKQQVALNCDMAHLLQQLEAGIHEVIKAEPDVTHFDSIVGDGDCGTTLKRGAEELLKVCQKAPSNLDHFLDDVVGAVERSMDGTSGALYSIFVNALRSFFVSAAGCNSNPSLLVDRKVWVDAVGAATSALSRYTPATIGDRTLMDTLIPFQRALTSGSSPQEAATIATRAADGTKFMTAKLGRAVYVGGQESWVGTVPDPGAWGLSRFLAGIVGSAE
ncbi:dihydroxyacetone kinase [Myriangium duriaei CBS 260.36]|uniref:Dihydroxyacetone kinase n=1 Tax=Myriangium duriaei CBS 260.36 TaxID=1168546 RepID=A0A9P4MK64_9PEZI|nr:dihydroxyacetone kinase [Myriangium duriaei CBS 260.36]